MTSPALAHLVHLERAFADDPSEANRDTLDEALAEVQTAQDELAEYAFTERRLYG